MSTEDTRPDPLVERMTRPLVMPADEFEAVKSVAAALDRESLRELIMAAAVRKDGPPPGERIADAIWPLLEHAQAAASGSHEGVRLWMADCGGLVAKHRARAEAAERKLADIADYIREHKGDAGFSWMHAQDILAITGSEEETGNE